MSSPKDTKSMTALEKIESLIKKIWFANIGLCSRSLDEVQNQYQRLNSESQKAFGELINRGRAVETNTRKAIDNRRNTLEGRFAQLRQRLVFKSRLSEQIDEVNAKLDKLAKAAAQS